ncbi:MAG: chemotaxis protein CheW [Parvularculaceae bacterium]
MASIALIIFEVGDARFALDRDAISRVAPVPRLTKPPAAPEAFAGFMRVGDELVAVLRAHVVLGIDGPSQPKLYDHLLMLRDVSPSTALAVDRVTDVIDADHLELMPVAAGGSHRECVVAEIRGLGRPILSLDLNRLLSDFERDRIRHFHSEEMRRRSAFGDSA